MPVSSFFLDNTVNGSFFQRQGEKCFKPLRGLWGGKKVTVIKDPELHEKFQLRGEQPLPAWSKAKKAAYILFSPITIPVTVALAALGTLLKGFSALCYSNPSDKIVAAATLDVKGDPVVMDLAPVALPQRVRAGSEYPSFKQVVKEHEKGKDWNKYVKDTMPLTRENLNPFDRVKLTTVNYRGETYRISSVLGGDAERGSVYINGCSLASLIPKRIAKTDHKQLTLSYFLEYCVERGWSKEQILMTSLALSQGTMATFIRSYYDLHEARNQELADQDPDAQLPPPPILFESDEFPDEVPGLQMSDLRAGDDGGPHVRFGKIFSATLNPLVHNKLLIGELDFSVDAMGFDAPAEQEDAQITFRTYEYAEPLLVIEP